MLDAAYAVHDATSDCSKYCATAVKIICSSLLHDAVHAPAAAGVTLIIYVVSCCHCCWCLLCLQILWSYGRRGNDDFFAYHGFVLGDNPDEDVVLFDDVGQLLYWAVQHVPQLQALRGQEQQLLAVAGGDGRPGTLDKTVPFWLMSWLLWPAT